MLTALSPDLARVTTPDDVVRAKVEKDVPRDKGSNGTIGTKTANGARPAGAAKARSAGSDRFVRTNYFPTMVYQYDVEGADELNETLLGLTYAEREGGLTVNKSNTAELGSWHSATNLHKNSAYEPIL